MQARRVFEPVCVVIRQTGINRLPLERLTVGGGKQQYNIKIYPQRFCFMISKTVSVTAFLNRLNSAVG